MRSFTLKFKKYFPTCLIEFIINFNGKYLKLIILMFYKMYFIV